MGPVHHDHVSININNTVTQTHSDLKSGTFGETINYNKLQGE